MYLCDFRPILTFLWAKIKKSFFLEKTSQENLFCHNLRYLQKFTLIQKVFFFNKKLLKSAAFLKKNLKKLLLSKS